MKLKIGIMAFGIMLLALLVSSLQSTSELPTADGNNYGSKSAKNVTTKPGIKKSTTNGNQDKSQIDNEIKKKSDNYYNYLSALFDLQEENADPAFEKLQALVKDNPDNISFKLMLAKAYGIKDLNKKALDIVDSIIKEDPKSEEAYKLRGELYLQIFGKEKTAAPLEEAKKAFLKVVEINPNVNDEQTLRILAIIFLDSGEKNRAQIYLERLFNDYPDHPLVYQNLETIYRDKKDEESLMNLYRVMSDYMPDNIQVKINLADVAFKLREYDIAEEALLDLEAQLKTMGEEDVKKEQKAFIYSQLGFISFRKNKYNSSLDYFVKARQFRDTLLVNLYIVYSLIQMEDYKTARIELTVALKDFKDNPNYNELLLLNSQLLLKEGKDEEGIKYIETLIDKNPKNIDFKLHKVVLLFELRRFEECRDYLEKIYERFPSEPRILFQLGSVNERLGDYDKSEKYFKLNIKLDPNDSAAMNYLGYMWADKGKNLEEAEKLIKKALKLDPTNSAYLDSLGWVYYKMEDYPKARYFLERAVREGVENAEVFDHLGDVYYKLEMYQEAIESWKKSLKDNDPNYSFEDVEKKLEATKKLIKK